MLIIEGVKKIALKMKLRVSFSILKIFSFQDMAGSDVQFQFNHETPFFQM